MKVITIDDKGHVEVFHDTDLHVEPYELRDACFIPCGCCGDAVNIGDWNPASDTCKECNTAGLTIYDDEEPPLAEPPLGVPV